LINFRQVLKKVIQYSRCFNFKLLAPDPYIIYGSGSSRANNIRIRLDPDSQHWQQVFESVSMVARIILAIPDPDSDPAVIKLTKNKKLNICFFLLLTFFYLDRSSAFLYIILWSQTKRKKKMNILKFVLKNVNLMKKPERIKIELKWWIQIRNKTKGTSNNDFNYL